MVDIELKCGSENVEEVVDKYIHRLGEDDVGYAIRAWSLEGFETGCGFTYTSSGEELKGWKWGRIRWAVRIKVVGRR